MFVLVFPPISSRVSGFPVASPCYGGSCKTCSFVLLPTVKKMEEVSYEMLVFLHPSVLSRVAGFPVASPCLWGKLANLSFSNVSKQVVIFFYVAGVTFSNIPICLIICRTSKNGGSLARNACFPASMCLVSTRWFSCGVAVSMGEAVQHLLFRMFPSR